MFDKKSKIDIRTKKRTKIRLPHVFSVIKISLTAEEDFILFFFLVDEYFFADGYVILPTRKKK